MGDIRDLVRYDASDTGRIATKSSRTDERNRRTLIVAVGVRGARLTVGRPHRTHPGPRIADTRIRTVGSRNASQTGIRAALAYLVRRRHVGTPRRPRRIDAETSTLIAARAVACAETQDGLIVDG